MKKTNLFLPFLVFLAIAVVTLTVLHNQKYSTQEIPITVSVGTKIGINVDSTALTFSTVMPGTSAERTINLDAQQREKVTLRVKDLDFVYPTETAITLEPGETKTARIIAAPGKDQPHGDYEGTLLVVSEVL